MIGHIHSIESFGTVDGPGVRFVVFFQGCPMRCLYCHNPDTWNFNSGHEYTADEIITKMTRNLPFYKTGGITATGGEPLCQIDFLIELFSLAKERGIHTCLDTSGCTFSDVNKEKLDTLLKLCDLIMLDIKHIDNDKHIKLTGRSNKSILDFARYVKTQGVELRIRHVLIPKINDDLESLTSLADFLKELLPLEKIEVLPYHDLGVFKYESLGVEYPLKGTPVANESDAKKALEIILKQINKQQE
ncbi:MAG: pyruvate formate lyase-activating protein [Clostridia bacterium]|nr:pyruvate formate lyase-activating protein [Clostridia bacterium]